MAGKRRRCVFEPNSDLRAARLKREEKWEAFQTEKRRLIQSGLTHTQADKEADAKFPPESLKSSPWSRSTWLGPPVPKEVAAQKKRGNKLEAMDWALENITVAVTIEDAPSMLAWTFLTACRIDQDAFVAACRDVYRAHASKQSLEEESRFADDGTPTRTLCSRVRAALGGPQVPVLPYGPEGPEGEPGMAGEDRNGSI